MARRVWQQQGVRGRGQMALCPLSKAEAGCPDAQEERWGLCWPEDYPGDAIPAPHAVLSQGAQLKAHVQPSPHTCAGRWTL